jgi:hypothetical protein
MVVLLKRMTPELAACVLEGLLLLHEELSVDPEAPWYVGTPDQTQVLHDELWMLAGTITPASSAARYAEGRSSLLPVACTGELVSSRHLAGAGATIACTAEST